MDDWTKSVLLAAALLVPAAGAHAACDAEQVKAALKVQAMFDQMSASSVADKTLVVAWGNDFASASPDKQKGLIRAYADTDACVYGSARRIVFTRNGQHLGTASPEFGIQFIE